MTSICTLNHALRTLYSIPDPSITFQQNIDIRNIYNDLSYSTYILHRPEHETLTLSFPRECEMITHLTNNYDCKMVYYITINGFLKEIQITPQTVIETNSNTTIVIYTRSKPDLTIQFNMVLTKSAFRSKL